MKLFKTWSLCATIAAGFLLVPAVSSFAQNPNHAPANLVLTVQSGTSTETDTVMASLGTQVSFRAAPQGFTSFGNINSTLVSAFGSNWADLVSSDPGVLYFGSAGTRSTTLVNGITDGDPRRTIYYSQARVSTSNPGSQDSTSLSFPLTSPGDGQFNAVNGSIFTMQNVLETQYSTAAVVSPETTSQVDDSNTFGGFSYVNLTGVQGTLGTAFSFGGAGSSVILALDLYRMTPQTATGVGEVVLGTDHQAYFLGNLTLANNGEVGFIAAVPEPSTAAMLGLTGLLALAARRRRALQA